MVLVGAIGFFSGINDSFNTRTEAAFIREHEGQVPWGNSNFTNWTVLNSTRPEADRVEMRIFDLVREKHLFKACIAFLITMMGVVGLRALREGKAASAMKGFQQTFFLFIIFVVFYDFERREGKWMDNMLGDLRSGRFNDTIYKATLPQAEPVHHRLLLATNETQPERLPHPTLNLTEIMDQMIEKVNEKSIMDKPNFGDIRKDQMPYGFNIYDKENWKHLHSLGKHPKYGKRHGRHPTVQADEDEDEDVEDDPYHRPDWPKLMPLRPIMFFFTLAAIYNCFFLKFVEKSWAKLEFLERTKILVKKLVKEQMANEPVTAAPESAEVAYRPILKKLKVEEAEPVQPVVVMPVAERIVNEADVEAAPSSLKVESFDYSTESVQGVDVVTEPPMTLQSATISSQNSMV